MAEIINFRPTPEAAEIIGRQKDEGTNISRWINNLITGVDPRKETTCVVYTIPEDSLSLYDSAKFSIWQMAVMHSVPLSRLSISRYREMTEVVAAAGMEYHVFRIDDDHYISIIAVSRAEASVEFARYYMQTEAKEYVRTSVPLPAYRYDIKNKVVIIMASE